MSIKEITRDLINSEKNYVSELNVFLKTYYSKIGKQNIIKKDKLNSIFGFTKAILKVNKLLYSQLYKYEEMIKGKEKLDTFSVGLVFNKLSPYINKAYFSYCDNYRRALEELKEVRQDAKVDKYIVSLEKFNAKKGFKNLEGYFKLPLDRILEYKLKLQKLLSEIKNLDNSYEESQNLKETLVNLETVHNYILQAIKPDNSVRKLQEKINKFSLKVTTKVDQGLMNILKPKNQRQVVFSGLMITVAKNGLEYNQYESEKLIYLFSDAILFCETSSHDYVEPIKLLTLDTIPLCWCLDITTSMNIFQVITPDETLTFVISDGKEKSRWLEKFTKVFKLLNEKKEVMIDEEEERSISNYVPWEYRRVEKLNSLKNEIMQLEAKKENAEENYVVPPKGNPMEILKMKRKRILWERKTCKELLEKKKEELEISQLYRETKRLKKDLLLRGLNINDILFLEEDALLQKKQQLILNQL